MIENYIIAAIALYTFVCVGFGYWIRGTEGPVMDQNENGVTGR